MAPSPSGGNIYHRYRKVRNQDECLVGRGFCVTDRRKLVRGPKTIGVMAENVRSYGELPEFFCASAASHHQ